MGTTERQKAVNSQDTVEPLLAPDRAEARGGSFSATVRVMFDRLAPRYDSFNHWASLGLDYGWRRAAIRSLQLSADARVLDVATGTGDLALTAARRVRRAVGCDFAPEMIRLAADKADGARGVDFQVARAEQLPYADGSFDGVTSAFAMRNVRPALDQVLGEMHRVLCAGGRLAILEFARPGWAPLRWGHELYLRVVMPRVGRWLTGVAEPFEYLHRSIDDWESAERFAERLRRQGFADVRWRRLGLGAVALHTGVRQA